MTEEDNPDTGKILIKESAGVFIRYPRILLLSFASVVCGVSAFYLSFSSMYPVQDILVFLEGEGYIPLTEKIERNLLAAYIVIGISFFSVLTVVSFFNTILISCTKRIIDNKTPKLWYCVATAVRNLPAILVYSAVTALVGVVLKAAEKRFSLVSRLVVYLLGASYVVLSFFALPSAVLGSENPIGMYSSSASIVRERFGDTTQVSLGIFVVGYIVANGILLLVYSPILLVLLAVLLSRGNESMIFLAERIAHIYTETTAGFVFNLTVITLVCSVMIVSTNFAAVAKTVLYVDTVGEERPEIFEEETYRTVDGEKSMREKLIGG